MMRLTEEQYEMIRPLLPVPRGNVRIGNLDVLFQALQEHRLIRIRVECVGLDSTSVKVHPDGTGARKKTARKPSASRAAAGPPRFIWLPRMSERP